MICTKKPDDVEIWLLQATADKLHAKIDDSGSNVRWLCARDMFPYLRPGHSYLIWSKDRRNLPGAHFCLALQGIGTEEAEAFSLLMEDNGLLRQLAGNPLCQYMLGFLACGNRTTS